MSTLKLPTLGPLSSLPVAAVEQGSMFASMSSVVGIFKPALIRALPKVGSSFLVSWQPYNRRHLYLEAHRCHVCMCGHTTPAEPGFLMSC